jgi:hypothetical protein
MPTMTQDPTQSAVPREPGPKNAWSEKTAAMGGDLSKRKTCGALTRGKTVCQGPAMKNGRCRMHGGKSTGPRTAEGRQRVAAARTIHGERSKAAIALRHRLTLQTRRFRAFLRELKRDQKRIAW